MATLFRHKPRVLFLSHRSFSITVPRSISLQWEKNDPEALADAIPPYPYPTRWYKQARLGLYGGQRIQFGNNVGPKIAVKTRRTWQLNVVNKKLYSKALERKVQVRVTVRVLRTIEKCGGLDEYLLGEKEARISTLGESGWWLRWAIMRTDAVQRRFAKERKALGLDELEDMQAPTAEGMENEVATIAEDESLDLVEEATEEEAQLAMEEGQSVTSDDTFTIDTSPGLPPLKFRVGPGQHVILTPKGWKRTRPHPLRWMLMDKEKMAKKRNVEAKVKNAAEADLARFLGDFDAKVALHNEHVQPAFAPFSVLHPEETTSMDHEQDPSARPEMTNTATRSGMVENTRPSQAEPLEAGATDQERDTLSTDTDNLQPEPPRYRVKLTNEDRIRMKDEARKILEKAHRKAAKRKIDRDYETHEVRRDVQTERRRFIKDPKDFSKHYAKDKAQIRKAIAAEHEGRV